MRGRVRNYLALLTGSTVLGLLLGWSKIGTQVDAWAFDFFLRLHPPPAQRSASIILAIDEESLEAAGGLLRLREPLARALETVSRFHPAGVAIDIVLAEPGSESENLRLEEALAGTPNVVLAAHLSSNGNPGGGSWVEPLERFRRRAAALGHVHADPDDDGVCRRILLAKAGGKTRLWALALEAYRLAHGGSKIVETESGLELGGVFIPAPRRELRALRIRYPNPESPPDRLSLKKVLEDPASAALVRNRVVFAGVSVLGGLDRYLMTPYSFGQAMSGVEINASVYETLAHGRFLPGVPDSFAVTLALAFAAALGVCFWKLEGNRALIAAATLLLAAHLTPLVFFFGNQVLAFTPPVAVAWLCFLIGGAYHHLVLRGKLSRAESQRNRYQRAVHYVTHEMRTPLTTIQGSSELISRYPLSEEKRQQIAGLIHQESKRLAEMVETFLSVEKLSAGGLKLRPEPIPADDIIAACLRRTLPLANRKQIEIRHAQGACERIWADRELVEYACYNLLTNAVKYSPAKTVITVRARHDNKNVQISVEDHGYGMDETELKHVFKKFYRTKRAQDSGESGTGLGLAIVEEIVLQHGGSIEVESWVNQGSRFTLRLPRATGPALETG